MVSPRVNIVHRIRAILLDKSAEYQGWGVQAARDDQFAKSFGPSRGRASICNNSFRRPAASATTDACEICRNTSKPGPKSTIVRPDRFGRPLQIRQTVTAGFVLPDFASTPVRPVGAAARNLRPAPPIHAARSAHQVKIRAARQYPQPVPPLHPLSRRASARQCKLFRSL